jgi:hypothetical protein
MRVLQRRNDRIQRQVERIEGFLADAFSPVTPSQEFITGLKGQLTHFSIPRPIPPANLGKYTFLAIVSVLGGGLLLAILIRFLIAWVAIMSLNRQGRQGKLITSA